MPWLELTCNVNSEQYSIVEQALEDLGVLSVTLLDAEDYPLFEPAPGETPLWPSLKLSALFEAVTDQHGLKQALIELAPNLTVEEIHFQEIADQPWERVWMDQFQPMQFGERLWIYPWTIEPPDDLSKVIVRLDPGLAFGTGIHPNTALCLEWLEKTDLTGKTVIDYGCGSGVLAIAALKLGASQVIGVDNDPQALVASYENAKRNEVADRLKLFLPDQMPCLKSEILIANILATPLFELAPYFAECLTSGAEIALSGILIGQEQELLECYSQWFSDLQVQMRDEWIRISGKSTSRCEIVI